MNRTMRAALLLVTTIGLCSCGNAAVSTEENDAAYEAVAAAKFPGADEMPIRPMAWYPQVIVEGPAGLSPGCQILLEVRDGVFYIYNSSLSVSSPEQLNQAATEEDCVQNP